MGQTLERDVAISVPGGPRLEGRLCVAEQPTAGLVVCHPHPLYGGDMDNPVVVRAVEVARGQGLTTLRFNFRGVGRSTGVHAGGDGEQDDVRAALELLASHMTPSRPMGLAGFSFGAWIAARVAGNDGEVAALCLIAPPLAMVTLEPLDGERRDVLLVAGTRDSYCPVPALESLASRSPGARVVTIDGADHFFFGKLYPLGEAIRAWIIRWQRLESHRD